MRVPFFNGFKRGNFSADNRSSELDNTHGIALLKQATTE